MNWEKVKVILSTLLLGIAIGIIFETFMNKK